MNDHIALGTYENMREVHYKSIHEWKKKIQDSKSFPQSYKKMLQDAGKHFEKMNSKRYIIKRNGWDWKLK